LTRDGTGNSILFGPTEQDKRGAYSQKTATTERVQNLNGYNSTQIPEGTFSTEASLSRLLALLCVALLAGSIPEVHEIHMGFRGHLSFDRLRQHPRE